MKNLNMLVKTDTPVISPAASIGEAIAVFLATPSKILPVVDSDGNPYGILRMKSVLTAKDIRQPVSSITDENIQIISTLEDLERMMQSDIKKIEDVVIVTDQTGKYQGTLPIETLMEALYHDTKYIEDVLHSIDAGILAIDRERKVVFYNHEWKRIHSMKDGQLLGEDIL
ncbi:MAG TPA: CBS domain-containing protein, partial [Anaerovoracaceae bacterium]|nr:CBS domain-containing protein [Anaerovoracaceae bacterium]